MSARSWSALALSLALGCAGPAPAVRGAPAAPPVTAAEASAIVGAAVAKVDRRENAAALQDLLALLERPGFEVLDPGLRHAALFDAGLLSLLAGDVATAHPLLRRSSELPDAGPADASARATAALRIRDAPDAARAVTLLARRWPAELVGQNEELVFRTVTEAKKATSEPSAYFELGKALLDAGWDPKSFMDPSWIWKDLALELLGRGDDDRAARVAIRVSSPAAIAMMTIDRRFDPIARRFPERFDVRVAHALELDRLRQRVRAEPRTLNRLVLLSFALLAGRGEREVLALTERPVASLLAGSDADWEDADEQGPGIMNVRATALEWSGRWDEAIDLLSRASARQVRGRPNVNQTINLAILLCGLGRADEALATLERVAPGDTNAYGMMQLERVRATAAGLRGDAPEMERALGYLRHHRADSYPIFQSALVRVGSLEEAAATFLSRLRDPRLRSDALAEAQDCDAPPPTPIEARWRARWEAMFARPEVQAAIAEVGRIEKLPICL